MNDDCKECHHLSKCPNTVEGGECTGEFVFKKRVVAADSFPAKDFLIDVMENEFEDKTFHKYIRNELAGDYAFHLAKVFRDLLVKAEEKHQVIVDLHEKIRDCDFEYNADYSVTGDDFIKYENGNRCTPFAMVQNVAKVRKTMVEAESVLKMILKQ